MLNLGRISQIWMANSNMNFSVILVAWVFKRLLGRMVQRLISNIFLPYSLLFSCLGTLSSATRYHLYILVSLFKFSRQVHWLFYGFMAKHSCHELFAVLQNTQESAGVGMYSPF